jgi:tetratricopeptide (TPR) repeat protein
MADQRSAQFLFDYNEGELKPYSNLQFTSEIDPAVLQSKTNLLQNLTTQYQAVLNYNVPKWSAASLFRLAYLNDNYANFLINAPVPAELSADEKAQYAELIAQQAAPYQEESTRYLAAGKDLVQRLGLLDKSLQEYEKGYVPFSSEIPFVSYRSEHAVSIEESLEDDDLYKIHQTLVLNEHNDEGLLKLSRNYYARGDYNQALMIATQYGEGVSAATQSELTNLAGVIYFNQGNIESARSAFLSATQLQSNNYAALSNLAALYSEYGAETQAVESFSQLPSDWEVPKQKDQRISIVGKHFKAYKRGNRKK